MARGRRTVRIVFIDSSVLFTAVNSPSGGSARLFSLKGFKLITSKLVLAEVERNVRKKLHSYHLERFFLLVEKLDVVSQIPSPKDITGAREIIVEKDAGILAEVKKARVDYLVTLDKKHFFTPQVEKFLKPKKALVPKMLFEFPNAV